MKKVVKYFGLFAALLAVIGVVLLMTTPIVTMKVGSSTLSIDGMIALFGHKSTGFGDPEYKLAWSALLAFIFAIVANLAEVVLFLLGVLKVDALKKVEKWIHLGVVILLVVAAIFTFMSKGVFSSVHDGAFDDASVGAGYVFAGILFIISNLLALVMVGSSCCKKCCKKCSKK